MAVGDIYRLTIRNRLNGVETDNVLHFRFKAAGGSDAGLRGVVGPAFANGIAGHQSNQYEVASFRTRGLVPYTDSVEAGPTSPIVGAVAEGSLPALCAAVVSLRTGVAGKSHRGRLYIAGIPNFSAPDGNDLTAAYVASLQTALNTLVATYGSAGTDPNYTWGVFSPKLGGTPKTSPRGLVYYSDPFNGAGFTPITATIVRLIVASFVSRKSGRGV